MPDGLVPRPLGPESSTNAFGMPVPALGDLLGDERIFDYVEGTLKGVLSHLGLGIDESEPVVRETLRLACTTSELDEYEREAHHLLAERGVGISGG